MGGRVSVRRSDSIARSAETPFFESQDDIVPLLNLRAWDSPGQASAVPNLRACDSPGQASADASDLVEAARNAEWEKVEVRRPQEAVFRVWSVTSRPHGSWQWTP